MLVTGRKIGNGIVKIQATVKPKTIAEMTIAERIYLFARPVRPTPENADRATQSVRATLIASGAIKPVAKAS